MHICKIQLSCRDIWYVHFSKYEHLYITACLLIWSKHKLIIIMFICLYWVVACMYRHIHMCITRSYTPTHVTIRTHIILMVYCRSDRKSSLFMKISRRRIGYRDHCCIVYMLVQCWGRNCMLMFLRVHNVSCEIYRSIKEAVTCLHWKMSTTCNWIIAPYTQCTQSS